MEEKEKVYGIGLDAEGRCEHYHTELDVVALRCGKCRKYYACYKCHDQLEDHAFVPADAGQDADTPVLCCSCNSKLTYIQYQQGKCAFCGHDFNPKCALHHDIYFAG